MCRQSVVQTYLKKYANKYSDRYIDVGIAEEHAVTYAAGLSAANKMPVVAIYSTFMQRAYDSIIHDIALQNLPAILCMDRAGLVGNDGPTHHGVFDVGIRKKDDDLYLPVLLREAIDLFRSGKAGRIILKISKEE